MKRTKLWRSMLAMTLVVCMLVSYLPQVNAAQTSDVSFEQVDDSAVTVSLLEQQETSEPIETQAYSDHDVVRVSIVLEGKSTIEQGFSTAGISQSRAAQSYRQMVARQQAYTTRQIEDATGEILDVEWNLTLVGNIISANVEYGQIHLIEQVQGVESVEIEQQYTPAVVEDNSVADPAMYFAGDMTNISQTWSNGYTGAGTRIAIIDTGTDTDHQSFSETAYLYALEQNAGDENLTYDAYIEKLNLLDEAEIEDKLPQLNVYARGAKDASGLYINSKLPFGYSYIDRDLDVTHDNDSAGNHGSHVAGIAAANRYIPGENEMENALSSVYVAGTAPDAQILTMKVFGNNGGAFESDFFAAIEDAIILEADTVNLSLGSSSPGFANAGSYQSIMENLKNSDTTVVISAGNASDWAYYSDNSSYLGAGNLYATDVTTDTVGSPASYTESLSVASVDNRGVIAVGSLHVGDTMVGFNGTSQAPQPIDPITSLDTSEDGSGREYPYIMVESYGAEGDFDDLEIEGKIVLVSRGMQINFADKANRAVEAGAIATIIYNNVPGTLNMNLDGYKYTNPCVMIEMQDAVNFKLNGTTCTDSTGETYYTGTMRIVSGLSKLQSTDNFYTMSSFSSWGVPGDLVLKPEVTAPGGNIYSVDGSTAATDNYVGMSGTSMAAPHVSGVGALVSTYVQQQGYAGYFANPTRGLVQSLLMSTATPLKDGDGNYYPVLQQGAGLVDAATATSADSYIRMLSDATASYDDGKVKAELGDDPDRSGEYTFGFEIRNLDGNARAYTLDADVFAQNHFEAQSSETGTYTTQYMSRATTALDANTTFTVNGESVESVLVPADGKVAVQVAITLTDYAKQEYLDKFFENGTYVEAFVYARAEATEEGVAGTCHSIPVLAFYGSWTDPSMFWGTSSADGAFTTNYRNNKTTDFSRAEYFNLEYQIDLNVWKVYEPENTFYLNNSFTTYCLGGNPLVADDTYMPERDAISNGATLTSGWFSLARNASQYHISVTNTNTGEAYYTYSQKENCLGAYSNSSGFGFGAYEFLPKVELNALVEGERINFTATFLPSYYDKGKLGENSTPGSGASASVTAVVDNTIPKVTDITMDSDANALRVTVADNEYVAAVVMYNNVGDTILTYTGAKQEIDPGESAVFELSLQDIEQTEILVQVYDYAMNMATYRVTIDKERDEFHLSGAMLAYDRDISQWVIADKNIDVLTSVSEKETLVFNAATSVEGTIFAVTETGVLYLVDPTNTAQKTYLSTLEHILVDMAYNAADGCIYGVSSENKLVRIDITTGASSVVGTMPFVTNTLACGNDGMFYSNRYGTGEIYAFTLDAVATGVSDTLDFNADGDVTVADSQCLLDYVVGNVASIKNEAAADMDVDGDIDTYDVYLLQEALPYKPQLIATAANTCSAFMQAMEVDPNSGHLFWASYFTDFMQEDEIGFSFLWEIVPESGEITRHYDLWDELSALVILDAEASSQIRPVNAVKKLDISIKDKTIAQGETLKLEAGIFPWNTNDRDVVWTTSDPTVAVVDENGVVTAMAVGICRITATSAADAQVSAACEIQVTKTAVEEPQENPVMSPQAMDAVNLVNNEHKPSYNQQTEQKTVVLSLTSEEDLHNGLQSVNYDTELLTLEQITGNGLVSYQQQGSVVTIGYVPEEMIAAGEPVVQLTFQANACSEDCDLIIRELQRNNDHITVESAQTVSTHSWGEWRTTEEAGCLTDGTQERTCGICGATEEKRLPATDHNWGAWKVVTAVTCLEDGEEQRICGNCGETQERTIVSAGVHNWGEWTVTKQPTETEDGEQTRTCSACGEVETESLPATGHICYAQAFTDVDVSRWYHSAIDYVVANKLMNGTSATTFAPDANTTRGQLVTILYRAAGSPSVAGMKNPFADVPTGTYYTDAVIWAANNGIVNGTSATTFAPNMEITREQLVTILHRYAGKPAADMAVLNSYTDAGSVSGFARTAMAWAVGNGVVNGTSATTLAPLATATRAQIAAILMRYLSA